MKVLQIIKQNLVLVIPLTMIAGFGVGAYANVAFLKKLIMPLTFLMVYPMMVNIQLRKIFEKGGAKVQLFTQLLNFVFVPFCAFFIGKAFFPDSPYLMLGLLLTSLLPTSGMTISWTGMAGGNMPAAIKMTVFGLIIGSLVTPLYIKLLLGKSISIPLGKIFQQIIIIVFLPLIFGNLTQRFLIKKYGQEKYNIFWKPVFPAFSTLGVVGIVFVAMALKAHSIIAQPRQLLILFLPLLILYGINFIISTITGKIFFERGDAIALVYGTVMRNLSIALAIAMTAFGNEGSNIALIIALGYVIQVQSAAWYVKFTDFIFGKELELVKNNS